MRNTEESSLAATGDPAQRRTPPQRDLVCEFGFKGGNDFQSPGGGGRRRRFEGRRCDAVPVSHDERRVRELGWTRVTLRNEGGELENG